MTRVTINTNEPLEDVSFLTARLNSSKLTANKWNSLQDTIKQLRDRFDLIAIRTNELYIFQEACRSYNIDLISLYCNERLSFELNSIDVNKALERNVFFELCYANAIRGTACKSYNL